MNNFHVTPEEIEKEKQNYLESLDDELSAAIADDEYYNVCLPEGHEHALAIYNENCLMKGELAYPNYNSNHLCGYPHGDVTFYTGTDDELETIALQYLALKDKRPGGAAYQHLYHVARTILEAIGRD